MMEAARDGKVNCIITKDLSRLGRNYLETSNLVETIFPFLGVRYISVNDHFDTLLNHNGNKELEIALKNLVNDMYARDISKRLVVTRKMDQKSGKFVGSNAPYGYKIDEQDPMRHYVVDEKAAAVVRQIFEWVLNGVTLRKVSLKLQEQRLRTPAEYYRTGKLYLEENDDPQVLHLVALVLDGRPPPKKLPRKLLKSVAVCVKTFPIPIPLAFAHSEHNLISEYSPLIIVLMCVVA